MEDFDRKLAQTLLETATRVRGNRDPIGTLARTVLDGHASLHDAAESAAFRDALADAFSSASDEVRRRRSGDRTVEALVAGHHETTERRSS